MKEIKWGKQMSRCKNAYIFAQVKQQRTEEQSRSVPRESQWRVQYKNSLLPTVSILSSGRPGPV